MPKRILAAGDPVKDYFLLPMSAQRVAGEEDWKRHRRFLSLDLRGGVYQTKAMLKMLIASREDKIELHASPQKDLKGHLDLHSLVELAPLDKNHKKLTDELIERDKTAKEPGIAQDRKEQGEWLPVMIHARIRNYLGYSPRRGDHAGTSFKASGKYNLILLNDAGGGVRRDENLIAALPNLLAAGGAILHKRHLPLGQDSDLQKQVQALEKSRCLLLVSAEDLREDGLRLSADLGWNNAVADIKEATRVDGVIKDALAQYRTVLILIGQEGVAMLSRADRDVDMQLIYAPGEAEGDTMRGPDGVMFGHMNALATALTADLIHEKDVAEVSPEAVRRALAVVRSNARGVYRVFLDETNPRILSPDLAVATDDAARKDGLQIERVDLSGTEQITLGSAGKTPLQLAMEIVRNGDKVSKTLPHVAIGKLLAVDPKEIAAYRQIDRSIRSYLESGREAPLSIGVFGAPGAGKSFGIKQIIAAQPIKPYEYNLSESSVDALAGYFQELRDIASDGKVPLCFFDEFDRNSYELIARFLAPMQDGTFRDGGRTHPIGRAIFVFAGGMAETLGDFREGKALSDTNTLAALKQLKVPDFCSRLEAVLEIGHINPESSNDRATLLRRAVILRSTLERFAKATVIDHQGQALIDDRLLEALLCHAPLLNGARSLEKLITMSALSGAARKFTVSDLPSSQFLSLHIKDADAFLRAAQAN